MIIGKGFKIWFPMGVAVRVRPLVPLFAFPKRKGLFQVKNPNEDIGIHM